MNIYAIHEKKADFIVSIFAQACDSAAVYSMRQLYSGENVSFAVVKDTELLRIASYDNSTGHVFADGDPACVCDLAELYLDVKSVEPSEDSDDDVHLSESDLDPAFFEEVDEK